MCSSGRRNADPVVDRALRRLPDGWLWMCAAADRLAHPAYRRRVTAWRRRLEESQRWSHDRLLAYQWSQLQGTLQNAHAHVPYYRRVMREMGAEPEDIRTEDDFRRLPTLSKAELQQHGEELLATNWPADRRQYVTTGGSTGIPVGFWMDRIWSPAAEWAFISTLWRRVGYREGDRSAILRGEPLPGDALWMTRPRANELRLSSYHLTDDRLPRYLERMRRFRPAYLQAYPSSASIVADFMLARGERPVRSLRAVLCGSENLYDWQRQQIGGAFGCRVFSWYGQSERVVLAGECEHSSELHVFPEYGYTELLDAAGRPIERPGRVGEIVGTAFPTRSMPLIRYRTGDAAAWADGFCERCGRRYRRFERIEGRLQEFIVSRTLRPISMTAINFHTDVFDNVRQFRFYQDTPGEVVLRVVPGTGWNDDHDPPRIRRELEPKLGVDTVLTRIEKVGEIPVGRSGKYQFLEQRLPIELGDSE